MTGPLTIDDVVVAFVDLPAKFAEPIPSDIRAERKVMFTPLCELEDQQIIRLPSTRRAHRVEMFGIR